MPTEVRIRPPNVLFETANSAAATQIAVFDGRFKAWRAPFEPKTLVELKRLFPDAEIIVGQNHIDDLKSRIGSQSNARTKESAGYKGARFKLPIPPKEHQWEGADYLELWDEGALLADCGVGKTFITLIDIVNKYRLGLISPSSVLVISKLMTLHTGWASDALKFTGLSSSVLWEPSNVKLIKGEKVHVADHGPKQNSLPSKVRTQKEFFHKTGSPAIISGPRAFDPRIHVEKQREWRESGNVKYGKETLTEVHRRNIGADSIRAKIAEKNTDVHVINHEGLIRFRKELVERRYDYVVLDESTVIKNNQSKIFDAICHIAHTSKYRRILTGTPMPQGPQDIWAQFYFLDKGLTFGTDYNRWLDEHFSFVEIGSKAKGTFVGSKVVPKRAKPGVEGTLEYMERTLRHRVFKRRLRDCADIPEVSIGILDVYLTPELRRHYDQME